MSSDPEQVSGSASGLAGAARRSSPILTALREATREAGAAQGAPEEVLQPGRRERPGGPDGEAKKKKAIPSLPPS